MTNGIITVDRHNLILSNFGENAAVSSTDASGCSKTTGPVVAKRKMSIEEVIEKELMLFKESPAAGGTGANPTNATTVSPVGEKAGKISILERALTEVFPTDRVHLAASSSDVDAEEFDFPSGRIIQTGEPSSSLYNPKKSPLKNRTEILCDILGIRG